MYWGASSCQHSLSVVRDRPVLYSVRLCRQVLVQSLDRFRRHWRFVVTQDIFDAIAVPRDRASLPGFAILPLTVVMPDSGTYLEFSTRGNTTATPSTRKEQFVETELPSLVNHHDKMVKKPG